MKRPRYLGLGLVVGALLVAAALASSAVAQTVRTTTEIGQATAEPGERTPTELAQTVSAGQSGAAAGLSARTPTELAQRVSAGQSGAAAGLSARTPTELAQTEPLVATVGPIATSTSSDEFNWGDAAIGAASALGLVALGLGGAFFLLGRRRRADRAAEVPVTAG